MQPVRPRSASPTPGYSLVALVIVACLVVLAGIGMTVHALRMEHPVSDPPKALRQAVPVECGDSECPVPEVASINR